MTLPVSLNTAEKPCPKCGSEMEHHRHRFSSDRGPNMPDADWDECPECGFKTEPE